MTHQFKVGDTGKTRDGRPYRVIATDLKFDDTIVAIIENNGGNEFAAMRFANGHVVADGGLQAGDLMPPIPAVYVNVYEQEDGTRVAGASTFTSREAADGNGRGGTRIGCIRVELGARFDG